MNLCLFTGENLGEEHLPLFEQFRTGIYEPAFPDIDEREPFENIIARIQDGGSPKTLAVLAVEGERPVGGLIADWYPGCRSLELIYIAVEPASARNGIGTVLLREGTSLMIDKLGGDVACVYAEVENPFSAPRPNGVIDPVSRLRFFARQGAVRIPINYVQPPLSAGQDYARNLFLLCFPSFVTGRQDCLRAKDLGAFLSAFYEGLAEFSADNPAKFSAELSLQLKQVFAAADFDNNIVFDYLTEKADFHIPEASVGCHFLLKNIEEGDTLHDTRNDTCPNFDSYETDLLNYFNQTSSRPFRTHHVPLKENVRLLLPLCYEYSSEGLTYFRLCARKSISVDISLNWSWCSLSGKYLAPIVLSPVYGENADYFTELDMVRFVSAFGSRQERYRCMGPDGSVASASWDGLKLEAGEGLFLSVTDWIRLMLDTKADLVYQGTGFSEVNLYKVSDGEGVALFRNFDDFRSVILDPAGPDEDFLWNKVMCGIVLGIFDFKRMSSPEIYDTIRPMVERKSSFMVLNRGHLMEVSYSDDKDNEKDEDLIVSPYLLIPSAALAFNECLLKESSEEVDALFADDGKFAENRYKKRGSRFYSQSRALQREVQKISQRLNDGYLKDIFHYVSEQDILREGSRERGHLSMLGSLEKRLDGLRGRRDYYLEEYKKGIDTNQNMLLLALAILQVVTAAFAGSKWWIIAAVSAAVLSAALFSGWLRIRKGRKD